MFERFTERARTSVKAAQEAACDRGHNWIGTEHLLLGLLADGDSVAARALQAAGADREALAAHVDETVGRGNSEPTGHVPFTPRAKRVLELSLREALHLGHNYIGTEHILLGLFREGEGVAAKVLVAAGLSSEAVTTQVVATLVAKGEERVAVGARRARSPRAEVRARRRGRPTGAACRDCGAALAENSAYEILDVPRHGGGDAAPVLFLFCTACGGTIETLIVPGTE